MIHTLRILQALLACLFALPALAAFTDNGDGTISDTVTGQTLLSIGSGPPAPDRRQRRHRGRQAVYPQRGRDGAGVRGALRVAGRGVPRG